MKQNQVEEVMEIETKLQYQKILDKMRVYMHKAITEENIKQLNYLCDLLEEYEERMWPEADMFKGCREDD